MIAARDRFRGCLLGGAVGDALGAGVEFLPLEQIRERFGPDGVTGYVTAYGRPGAITDDTQMTLFTAEGLLRARSAGQPGGETGAIWHAYRRWLLTQDVSHRWAWPQPTRTARLSRTRSRPPVTRPRSRVATYCALAAADFRSGVLLAVNHGGDSDSTGAICGNLLGATLGAQAIDADLLAGLEGREVIEQVADDLCDVFAGRQPPPADRYPAG